MFGFNLADGDHALHPAPDFQALFMAMPGPAMVLGRDLTILSANDAYIGVTGLRRDQLEGRFVFDVFQDDPNDPDARAVEVSTASLRRVIQQGRADTMAVQRHDVMIVVDADGERRAGQVEERYWRPVNIPIFDSGGEVGWILHTVEDVTDLHRMRRRISVKTTFTPRRRHIIRQLRDASPVLRGLDDPVFELIAEHLTPLALREGQVLIGAFEPVEAVYFLLRGVVSVSRELEDGTSTGVAVMGPNGMAGESVLVGPESPATETRVQVAGFALRLDADILNILMAGSPSLRAALSRQALPALLATSLITAACNARHTMDQRLARLLLSAHAWAASMELPIRQDSIAMMIGVRRTGVSEALARMSGAGVLRTGRNRIRIDNLPRLEQLSCDCYRDLNVEFARIGVTAPRAREVDAAELDVLCTEFLKELGAAPRRA